MADSSNAKPDLSRLRIDRSRPGRRPSLWGPTPKFLALIVLACGAWLFWQRRAELPASPEPETSDPGWRLVTVRDARSDGAEGVSGNGYVIARRRAALSTVLSGRLVEINVEEGSTVRKGDVVARIQHDDYEVALREAESLLEATRLRRAEIMARAKSADRRAAQSDVAVKVARGQVSTTRTLLEAAMRDRDRNRKSYLEKDISEATWDALVTEVDRLKKQLAVDEANAALACAAVETARSERDAIEIELGTQDAEIARIEAQVKAAAITLEKTFVRAPFDGIIINKGAEEGEVVAATGAGGNSRGSVATLVDLKTLEVQVELPETRLGRIHEKQPCRIFLDVAREEGWAGHVRQIWPTADRGKGTVEIRIVFDERPQVLRPEMGARVVFLNEMPEGADSPRIDIPLTCIEGRGDESFVWVVKNGRLRRRRVKTGSREAGLIEIRAGLKLGEQVVDRPSRNWQDGQPLEGKQR